MKFVTVKNLLPTCNLSCAILPSNHYILLCSIKELHPTRNFFFECLLYFHYSKQTRSVCVSCPSNIPIANFIIGYFIISPYNFSSVKNKFL